MSIASSIPSLAGKFHVHDRKFVGYAGSWGWDLSGSPTICGSIRVFSFAVLEIFGRENTRTFVLIIIIKQMVSPEKEDF